jgi:hypothetical protein
MRTILLSIFSILLLSSCGKPTTPTQIFDIRPTAGIPQGEFNSAKKRAVIEHLVNSKETYEKIRHLYIISIRTGTVLIYSPVKGEVISSGKRLTPRTLDSAGVTTLPIQIGKKNYYTTEIPDRDGLYGESMEYIYWRDGQGVKHKHYRSANEMIHISDQKLPIATKTIKINFEKIKIQNPEPAEK